MPRGLGLLLLLLLLFSCTSGASFRRAPLNPSAGLELAPSERAVEQRRSLRHVFYRNNEMPRTPSASELRRLDHNLKTAPPVEVHELHGLFGDDAELLAYATRDSDGDGVLDYRISEYRGKFYEGDIDVDGDGIRNVYDVAPYDAQRGGVDTNGDGVPDQPGSFADRDGDGIPDHLDWSRAKADTLPDIQAGLFRDFGIILVERSARFTPELAQAVDDTMRHVFREPLPTLRTVATEDQLLISPDLGDNGFMLGQTQTLTICVGTLDGAPPVVLLGLVVHEVDHAWQLAQDFDPRDVTGENKRMHFPPGNFTMSLARFGWEIDEDTIGEGYHHRLYWPHFFATSPRYLYRGSSPSEWADWFEQTQRSGGPEFLRTSPAATWGMVGPYSLTSPWEWHADQLMAMLYNRLDRGVSEHDNHTYQTVSSLLRARMLLAVQYQWSRFDYRNAAGTSIDRELRERFELSPAEVELLVDRYVIPLADLPVLSEALALETEAGSFELLTDSLGGAWDGLRGTLGELDGAPGLHTLVHVGVGPWQAAEPRPEAEADTSEDGELPAEPAAAPSEEDEAADVELAALDEAEAEPRAGLSSRARLGAGRVGGVVEELEPGHDLLAGAGDAELEDGGAGLGEGTDRANGSVRHAVDPVVSLFEELRRVVPKVELPAEGELPPEGELVVLSDASAIAIDRG